MKSLVYLSALLVTGYVLSKAYAKVRHALLNSGTLLPDNGSVSAGNGFVPGDTTGEPRLDVQEGVGGSEYILGTVG